KAREAARKAKPRNPLKPPTSDAIEQADRMMAEWLDAAAAEAERQLDKTSEDRKQREGQQERPAQAHPAADGGRARRQVEGAEQRVHDAQRQADQAFAGELEARREERQAENELAAARENGASPDELDQAEENLEQRKQATNSAAERKAQADGHVDEARHR